MEKEKIYASNAEQAIAEKKEGRPKIESVNVFVQPNTGFIELSCSHVMGKRLCDRCCINVGLRVMDLLRGQTEQSPEEQIDILHTFLLDNFKDEVTEFPKAVETAIKIIRERGTALETALHILESHQGIVDYEDSNGKIDESATIEILQKTLGIQQVNDIPDDIKEPEP